jgi:hypothetical protein
MTDPADIAALNAPTLATVTWTPRGGSPRVITGDYLDKWGAGTTVELGCGIEQVLVDLGLPQFNDGEHCIAVCALVNHQLRHGSVATLHCPDGVAVLELLPLAQALDGSHPIR